LHIWEAEELHGEGEGNLTFSGWHFIWENPSFKTVDKTSRHFRTCWIDRGNRGSVHTIGVMYTKISDRGDSISGFTTIDGDGSRELRGEGL
jgi:hypothetical protein